MKVAIKRIDVSLPLPVYETDGSVGFDLLTRAETLIKPREVGLIPTNVIVKVPKGYMLLVAARSSTPRKKGLLIPHGIGIIDHDYCGPNDEILVQVYNFTEKDVVIQRGEKIAQGVLVKIGKASWREKGTLKKTSRGGFGSTDKR
jgi:dUTP pyrophosphatase